MYKTFFSHSIKLCYSFLTFPKTFTYELYYLSNIKQNYNFPSSRPNKSASCNCKSSPIFAYVYWYKYEKTFLINSDIIQFSTSQYINNTNRSTTVPFQLMIIHFPSLRYMFYKTVHNWPTWTWSSLFFLPVLNPTPPNLINKCSLKSSRGYIRSQIYQHKLQNCPLPSPIPV